MRIPKIGNYSTPTEKEYVDLPEIEFNKPSYIFYNDKQRHKFIKKVEQIVRSSYEQRKFIDYCHYGLGMNYDMFANNISNDKGKRVRIEIHHIPFGLYDIVNIVLTKYEAEEMKIDPLMIAKEVVSLHYKGMVGLVPLSETVHQLYHRGDIFIPLQCVDKGFVQFYREYKPYLKDYEGMLVKLVEMSKSFSMDANNHILQKKYIYLNNSGYDSIPERIK